ncbi:hypothetical protein NDU88_003428 [Pleurodeles waltl]|uniref:Uncharacterized protein n=1 Tax=Pleurodeles waltl TaxID=8319 RepID=A0AAV7RF29_PLEWA|nr:hypothetical protein NDU88_003428 [Pleurodeles waltl]
MDANISALIAETKTIRQDIDRFQLRVQGLEQRVATVEDHLNVMPDCGQELLFLCSKVVDLEDRSRRNKVSFYGFPEQQGDTNIAMFFSQALPVITGLTFDRPLEFQRVHRMGPKHPEGSARSHPIITCFLRHEQVRQLLTEVHTHGPYSPEGLGIHMSADFSKETNDQLFPPPPPTSRHKIWPL